MNDLQLHRASAVTLTGNELGVSADNWALSSQTPWRWKVDGSTWFHGAAQISRRFHCIVPCLCRHTQFGSDSVWVWVLDGQPTWASAEKLEKVFQKNTALCCSARVFCFFTVSLFSFLTCISINALSSPVWLPTSHSLFNLNFRKTFAIRHLLKHCEVSLSLIRRRCR